MGQILGEGLLNDLGMPLQVVVEDAIHAEGPNGLGIFKKKGQQGLPIESPAALFQDPEIVKLAEQDEKILQDQP